MHRTFSEVSAMRRISSMLAATAAVWSLHAGPASAQATGSTDAQPAAETVEQKPPAAVGEEGVKPTRGFVSSLGHNLVDDLKHIPRRNSAYWLAGGAAMAYGVHSEDGKINRRLLGSSAADTLFKPGKYVGNGATIVGASFAAYAAGRWMEKPRLQHLGMDEIEGAILSQAITEAAKFAIRRDRPIQPGGKQASGYSMPSGHAALTFTAATILQQHLGYKAGVPTYLIASYVAMSRLHDNNHYASDVIAGAATGIIIGRSVTYHGRNFWGGPVIVPGGVEFVLAKR
jgi:membrane-associated phospholipid phosphatase